MTMKFQSARYYTPHLDCVENDGTEVVGYRILALLDYICEIDTIHGFFAINKPLTGLMQEEIESYLSAPVADGEYVDEIFQERGQTAYRYEYVQGDFLLLKRENKSPD